MSFAQFFIVAVVCVTMVTISVQINNATLETRQEIARACP